MRWGRLRKKGVIPVPAYAGTGSGGNPGGLSVVAYAGVRMMPAASNGSPLSRGRQRGRELGSFLRFF